MVNPHKVKAFTLLELIITIIIIGIFASLALPMFYSTVEFSRSSEAMKNLSILGNAVERCGSVNMDLTGCDNLNALDVGDPGSVVGASFSYSITIASATEPFDYTIKATRNNSAADYITLRFSAAGISKDGEGVFVSIR